MSFIRATIHSIHVDFYAAHSWGKPLNPGKTWAHCDFGDMHCYRMQFPGTPQQIQQKEGLWRRYRDLEIIMFHPLSCSRLAGDDLVQKKVSYKYSNGNDSMFLSV